jgi:hypothetical protein
VADVRAGWTGLEVPIPETQPMTQRQDDQSASPSILVVRSGGFTGLRQQWQVDAHDDVEEWLALVRACVPDALLVGPWRALVDRVQEVGAHG